jgi:hypothetical protein
VVLKYIKWGQADYGLVRYALGLITMASSSN